jgi:excisionase family DNA binding protein
VTDRRALRISEVAESIGVDHETVRRWVVSGKLRGVRVGGVWLVPVTGLDLLLEGYDARRGVRRRDDHEAIGRPAPGDGERRRQAPLRDGAGEAREDGPRRPPAGRPRSSAASSSTSARPASSRHRRRSTVFLRSWIDGLRDAKRQRVRPRTLDHYSTHRGAPHHSDAGQASAGPFGRASRPSVAR